MQVLIHQPAHTCVWFSLLDFTVEPPPSESELQQLLLGVFAQRCAGLISKNAFSTTIPIENVTVACSALSLALYRTSDFVTTYIYMYMYKLFPLP